MTSRILNRIINIILPAVVIIHVVLFGAFWLTNSLFYASSNDYLTKLFGKRMDYVSLCLLVSVLVGIWAASRMILYRARRTHRLAGLSTGLFSVVALIYLAFFYESFHLLFKESPAQIPRLGQMLLYFRIILDPILLLGAALLAGLWLRRQYLSSGSKEMRGKTLPIFVVIAILVVFWAGALTYPPDSVYRGKLPAKPLIIAHRGASMLAPENTLASANLAADLGVYGLETDIHISRDGIPFLMHDNTFERTTNVTELFPNRVNDRAETFTFADVKQLNAGKWFIEQDPYKSISSGMVNPGQIEGYAKENVPALADELQIARKNNLIFIFDLEQPPENHPYAGSFFNICFNQIQAAGIDPQVWFLVDKDHLNAVRSAAPAMKLAYGVNFQSPPLTADLHTAGYQIVNAEYGLSKDWIRKYQNANLWVNLYVIDEPWQFSRLWLLGVNSTTTSNAKAMIDLDYPFLSMPFGQYVMLWSGIGILSLAIFLGLTIPVYRRSTVTES